MKDVLNCTSIILGDQFVATFGNGISRRLIQYVECLDIHLLQEYGEQESLEKKMGLHQFINLSVLVQNLTF